MKKLLVALAILLYPLNVFAARASLQDKVTVNGSFNQVCDWIESHRMELEESTDSQVISEDGNKATIKKVTADGEFRFVVTLDTKRGLYREALSKNITGDLVDTKSELNVEEVSPGQCEITIRIMAEVDNVPTLRVVGAVKKSIRGVKSLFDRKFNR